MSLLFQFFFFFSVSISNQKMNEPMTPRIPLVGAFILLAALVST